MYATQIIKNTNGEDFTMTLFMSKPVDILHFQRHKLFMSDLIHTFSKNALLNDVNSPVLFL